ncbi:HugZ family protein [Pelagicoccus mobilis]|uniref:Pyridoxamine 5'-phosphate oxidase family protein n=1 Tax=Pelagicoccus mobilis TaxID=415221 RepID=A0A934RV94_9BACT|nr:pyridoxamine 5'-phosphate oxidase family protein [Pelagicoccus mobilis]MBK1877033.1 pyridoxamine 5'-phosphate oxidase family protein [Pelagicoccus mobilis]
MNKESEELAGAQDELRKLLDRVRSCMLATVSNTGSPLSSYAPVWINEKGEFYVYVSAMAKHYGHLKKSGVASVALIEDETHAEELFARKRVTVNCSAELIERGDEEWALGMAGLEKRHGSIVGYLKDLVDFDLFRLRPSEGRLVLGFGKAYRIFGDGLSEIGFLGAGGHRKKS